MMWMNIIKVIVSKICILKVVITPGLQREVYVLLLTVFAPPKEALLGLGLAGLEASFGGRHFVEDIVENMLLLSKDAVLVLDGA